MVKNKYGKYGNIIHCALFLQIYEIEINFLILTHFLLHACYSSYCQQCLTYFLFLNSIFFNKNLIFQWNDRLLFGDVCWTSSNISLAETLPLTTGWIESSPHPTCFSFSTIYFTEMYVTIWRKRSVS